MSTEAHKLIGISLSKIAQSRASRGGVSLHKNLLVATVLHKARYIFMEEAYQLVHGNNKSLSMDSPLYQYMEYNNNSSSNDKSETSDEDQTDSSLSEWRGAGATTICSPPSGTGDDKLNATPDHFLLPKLTSSTPSSSHNYYDTTQKLPPSYQAHIELTYLNLDKCSNETSDNMTDNKSSLNSLTDSCDDIEDALIETPENNTLKRRRSEWEVEEAVMSILPKKAKALNVSDNNNGNVCHSETPTPISSSSSITTTDDLFFLEDFLPDSSLSTRSSSDNPTTSDSSPSMEIDRLSSLVSIFSFANLTDVSSTVCDDDSKSSIVNVSSAPDQCSTQAKDNSDSLQPIPPFLAMTV